MIDAGWKMNPETWGKYRSRGAHGNAHAKEGYDEIVICESCGWTWWVHRR